jgi:hypothetical protein
VYRCIGVYVGLIGVCHMSYVICHIEGVGLIGICVYMYMYVCMCTCCLRGVVRSNGLSPDPCCIVYSV